MFFSLLYPQQLGQWLTYNKLLLCSYSVMSDSLEPHGLQHARLPCPSPSPGVCANSCPLSRWCHLTILSSVTPFSSCSQSFSASASFPMSQLFASNKLLKIFNKYMSEELPIPFFFFSFLILNSPKLFPGSSDGKESVCTGETWVSILGLERFRGEGNGFLLQYSCLENSRNWASWWAIKS